MKNGIGEMRMTDGRKYVGERVDGKQHGAGIFYNGKGKEKKCFWKNGKQICKR